MKSNGKDTPAKKDKKARYCSNSGPLRIIPQEFFREV